MYKVWKFRESESTDWKEVSVDELRSEIKRTHESVRSQPGVGISDQPVYVNYKAYGLFDIMLVDLPGFTYDADDDMAGADMAAMSKRIDDLAANYLDPLKGNFIVLADAARDLESMRSLTEKVMPHDPHLERTVLVRTKFDLYHEDLRALYEHRQAETQNGSEEVVKWVTMNGVAMMRRVPTFAVTCPNYKPKVEKQTSYPAAQFKMDRDNKIEEDIGLMQSLVGKDHVVMSHIGFQNFARSLESKMHDVFSSKLEPTFKAMQTQKEKYEKEIRDVERVIHELEKNADPKACAKYFGRAVTNVISNDAVLDIDADGHIIVYKGTSMVEEMHHFVKNSIPQMLRLIGSDPNDPMDVDSVAITTTRLQEIEKLNHAHLKLISGGLSDDDRDRFIDKVKDLSDAEITKEISEIAGAEITGANYIRDNGKNALESLKKDTSLYLRSVKSEFDHADKFETYRAHLKSVGKECMDRVTDFLKQYAKPRLLEHINIIAMRLKDFFYNQREAALKFMQTVKHKDWGAFEKQEKDSIYTAYSVLNNARNFKLKNVVFGIYENYLNGLVQKFMDDFENELVALKILQLNWDWKIFYLLKFAIAKNEKNLKRYFLMNEKIVEFLNRTICLKCCSMFNRPFVLFEAASVSFASELAEPEAEGAEDRASTPRSAPMSSEHPNPFRKDRVIGVERAVAETLRCENIRLKIERWLSTEMLAENGGEEKALLRIADSLFGFARSRIADITSC